jgi:heme o synthase
MRTATAFPLPPSLASAPAAAPRLPGDSTTATERAGRAAAAAGVWQRLRDYVTLTKPYIISLLLVTTVAAMVVAAGGWPGWGAVAWASLGGYLMAGGANAMNMWWDRDIDAVMKRTEVRAVPPGRMSAAHALGFGVALAAAAFAMFALAFNVPAAVLALAGLVYYVGIYTAWLKRRSPQNIVIGGGAGAFAPLVGWVAVTGELSWTAAGMFLVVCLWTPPHFWALALVKRRDYGSVGVPMAPNVWGTERTLRQMAVYTVLLVAASFALVLDPALGVVYGVSAALVGGWFLRGVVRLARAEELERQAWKLYRGSLLYLALLFGAMLVDGLV